MRKMTLVLIILSMSAASLTANAKAICLATCLVSQAGEEAGGEKTSIMSTADSKVDAIRGLGLQCQILASHRGGHYTGQVITSFEGTVGSPSNSRPYAKFEFNVAASCTE